MDAHCRFSVPDESYSWWNVQLIRIYFLVSHLEEEEIIFSVFLLI